MNTTVSEDIKLSTTTKTRQRKRHTRQLAFNCMSGVYPKRTHGLGMWHNEREVFSVRVDNGLAKQFTLASKALFGSTCSAVESYMAAVVGWWQNPELNRVYPSTTSKVEIGKIEILRNVRERRKVVVDRVVTETVVPKQSVVQSPIPKVDYSKMGLEKLQRLYDIRLKLGKPTYVLAAELRRRQMDSPNLSYAKPLEKELGQ